MTTRFVHRGATSRPSSTPKSWDAYEWSLPNPRKYGRGKIRFMCAAGDTMRRFHIEPVWRQWIRGEQNAFVERACGWGYKILAALESHPPQIMEAYKLYLAIFRNRHTGHHHISRRLSNIQEYAAKDPATGIVRLITPGRDAEKGQGTRTFAKVASDLINIAFRKKESEFRNVDVIRYYIRMVEEQRSERPEGTQASHVLQIDRLFGRT